MEWMLLPYRRYFEFSGRSRRKEYWLFVLFYFLVSAGIQIVFGVPVTERLGYFFRYSMTENGSGVLISNLFGLISFIPALAVNVRRLHDVDRSGWWLLLWLIPFFGWIVLLVFLCLDGSLGRNRYGSDPKGRGTADIFS